MICSKRKISGLIAMFIIMALFICAGYSPVPLSSDKPIPTNYKATIIHINDSEYFLASAKIAKDRFIGYPSTESGFFKIFSRSDQIHLYLNPDHITDIVENQKIEILFSNITKIETYELNMSLFVVITFAGILLVLWICFEIMPTLKMYLRYFH